MGSEVRRVVVTVHGIRTFGQWQQRLARMLKDADPTIQTENYQYGYFSVLAFLLPPFRWLATRRFQTELKRIAARHGDARISIVAHSFGTHLVAWGLRGMKPEQRPHVHTLILAGSVLTSDFRWADLLDDQHVERVVNDCGTDDAVLILSQFCVLLTGMAGRLGFIGMSNERFMNRYFVGGHSHYFNDPATPDDAGFMARHWLPLLVTDAAPVHIDQRENAGPVQGATIAAMQIAEPVKLLAYIGLPIFLLMVFHFTPLEESRKLTELHQRLAAAETGRAEAENAAYTQMVAIGAHQRARARTVWLAQSRAIEALPPSKRVAAFNASLAILDDAFLFDFDSNVLRPEAREILDHVYDGLRAIDFKGEVRLWGSLGRFCAKEVELLPDMSPIAECSGMGEEYALALAMRLSSSVATYLVQKGFDERRIQAVSIGFNPGGLPYPTTGYAKQWNLVARHNNKVTISLK